MLQLSVICLLFLLPQSSHGQFNILVGYGLGYTPAKDLNEAIDDHNRRTDWYKVTFDDVRLIHGLHLGVRYGFDYFKTTLHYKNSGIRLRAEGIPPNEEEAFSRRLFFRNNLIGLGIESNYEMVNWGISLDFNQFRIGTETSDLSDSYNLQTNNFLSSHFYLNLDFYGENNLGFTLQPYVQIPLQTLDLQELATELDLSSREYQHQHLVYGITLLMVNGPQ